MIKSNGKTLPVWTWYCKSQNFLLQMAEWPNGQSYLFGRASLSSFLLPHCTHCAPTQFLSITCSQPIWLCFGLCKQLQVLPFLQSKWGTEIEIHHIKATHNNQIKYRINYRIKWQSKFTKPIAHSTGLVHPNSETNKLQPIRGKWIHNE